MEITPPRAAGSAEVTHSVAHYLLALAGLLRAGETPRAADLARALRVSRAAASLQLRALVHRGLVDLGENRRLRLSAAGLAVVARLDLQRETFRTLLRDALGVPAAVADADACKVEHLLSEDTTITLTHWVRLLLSGHPAALACRDFFRELTASCPPATVCDACKARCVLPR
jgi:DtxR family Mn-dependent transcriptional regulator